MSEPSNTRCTETLFRAGDPNWTRLKGEPSRPGCMSAGPLLAVFVATSRLTASCATAACYGQMRDIRRNSGSAWGSSPLPSLGPHAGTRSAASRRARDIHQANAQRRPSTRRVPAEISAWLAADCMAARGAFAEGRLRLVRHRQPPAMPAPAHAHPKAVGGQGLRQVLQVRGTEPGQSEQYPEHHTALLNRRAEGWR
jgi:hypothetical protein